MDIGDNNGKENACENMGTFDLSLANTHEEYIAHHEKSLSIAIDIDDKIGEGKAYENLGNAYQSLGKYSKAIEYHEKTLNIAKDTGNKNAEGASYENLGIAYKLFGKYHEAIEYHKKSLSIAKDIANKDLEGEAYWNLGLAYKSLGKYQEAIEYQEKSISIAKDIGNKYGEGASYANLGSAYQLLGKYHEAIEYYKKSLSIAKDIGNKDIEGKAYLNLGITYKSLGKYQEAIEYQEKSLSIAKDIGDKNVEGEAYLNLGNAYQLSGKYYEAIEYHKKSLSIAIDIDNKDLEGASYANLGIAYDLLSKYRETIECYKKILSIAKDRGDKDLERKAYLKLGSAYKSLGKYQEAIKYNEKSLNIAKAIGDKKGEGESYCNLGIAYDSLSKYREAIEYYKKMLSIAKDIGDKDLEKKSYLNLGNSYQSLGKYHEAIKYHEKSLSIAKDIGEKRGEGNAYLNLGNCYLNLGNSYSYLGNAYHDQSSEKYEEAIKYQEKSLYIAKDIGDKYGEGASYENLGIAYNSLGKYQEAIEYHKKSLNIAKDIGINDLKGTVYLNLGITYKSLGKYQEAIEYHKKSLDIAKDIGNKDLEATVFTNLGLVHYALSMVYKETNGQRYQDNMKKTENYLRDAVQCCDWLFDHLKDEDDFKVSIVETFIKTYELLTTVMIKTQRVEEALLVSDRGRARGLGDLLISKYGMTQEIALKSHPLEYNDVKNIPNCDFCVMCFALQDNNVAVWVLSHETPLYFHECGNMQTGDQEEQMEPLITKVVNSAYDNMKVREAVHCENRSLELLGNSDVEDQLHVIEESSSSLGETNENTEKEEISDEKSHRRCAEFEEEFDTNPLEILFDGLLAPVFQNLNQEEVVIIPDGPLYMVPFAALRDPNTGLFLSETKRVRLAPSFTALKLLEESPADYHSETGALIVGDPEVGKVMFKSTTKDFGGLPGAKREAQEISDLLGVTALIGSQATKQAIKQRLQEGVAVIHFAAHGSTEGEIALAPCVSTETTSIPQEQDYLLTMKDVQESGIKAQLVVLSCCHSGRGDIKAEGVVGMSRAFLAAGARAVVASLWAIDDSATMVFMLNFYRHLKIGHSASTSLQQAMKEMRDKGHYTEPRYWAPFFLIGADVTISV